MSGGTKAERRKEPRQPCTDRVRLEWVDAESQIKWALGQCVDISPRGMRIEIKDPVSEIRNFRFDVVRANFRGAATVRNRAAKGRVTVIGVEFGASVLWQGAARPS